MQTFLANIFSKNNHQLFQPNLNLKLVLGMKLNKCGMFSWNSGEIEATEKVQIFH